MSKKIRPRILSSSSVADFIRASSLALIIALAASISGCGGGGGGGGGGSDAEPATPSIVATSAITARTGPILAVRVGETAMLSDRNSNTTSTQPLQYAWSFSYRPDGSRSVLRAATSRNPSFVADIRGTYMVKLVVRAGNLVSEPAIQLVVVTDPSERPTGPFNHQGLSSACFNCHNETLDQASGPGKIPGKSGNHLATTNSCESCHTPLGFGNAPYVDHDELFGQCSECHNGELAVGKSEFHQPTDAECDNCHNTGHFLELEADGSYDHSGISRACSGCHNGIVARGKTPTPPHPDSNSECGYCHTIESFQGAYPDHTGPLVVGNRCDSCHGVSAIGEPQGHPTMAIDCDSCHGIARFSLDGVFQHRIDAAIQSCDTCHNDNANTNFNGLAPGKGSASPTHLATSQDCTTCHNTESFTPAFIDHSDPAVLAARCDSCHGVSATGKSANHMPTTEDCGVCHTPGSFDTGVFTHGTTYLASFACNDCHDNQITVGKLPGHFPTPLGNNQDCADCHDTIDFSGTRFDHAGIDTNNCGQCHNGDFQTTSNTLFGKPSFHLPTAQDCNLCHAVADAFSPATNFAHLGIGDNCESCHNGKSEYVAIGAIAKSANHIPASEQCEVCHTDTTAGGFASSSFLGTVHVDIVSGCEGCHVEYFFPTRPDLVKQADHLPTEQDCDLCHTVAGFGPPTTFAHSGISDNCSSCHDGSSEFVMLGALGKTPSPPHPLTSSDCSVCHNTSNFADAFVDHTDPDLLAMRCDSCHNGSDAIGKDAKPDHVSTIEDCSVCHTAGGSFTPAIFDHTGITGNCASCHNGIDATGTNAKVDPPHIPITGDCSVCHVPTSFANARFEHQGIVDNCANCHNGITAVGKGKFHVPTNGDCVDCHVTTGFRPATFDHVGITGDCAACHDAGFATPKSASHVATSQDCGVCHNTAAFVPATFDHSGIVDNCVSCHDGDTATGMADAVPAHIPTGLDCHFCHTTATFAGGSWVHDSTTANNCDTCHSPGGGASSKPGDHLSTTEQCDTCHTTGGWAPTSFSHSPSGNYPGDHRRDPGCSGCHGNTISSNIPWPSPQYQPFCAACHARDFQSEDDHNGGKNGTIEQNKDCSGGGQGCHRVSSSEF